MLTTLIFGTLLVLGAPQNSFGPFLPDGAQKLLWRIVEGQEPLPLASLLALEPRQVHDQLIPIQGALPSDQGYSDSLFAKSDLGFTQLFAAEGSVVLSNRGDRVVIAQGDKLRIFKDDDAILRQAGVRLQVGFFADGSSRSVIQRADGTQVMSLRDVSGRVWQRIAYDKMGQDRVLIDDLRPEEMLYHDDIAEFPFAQPIYLEDRDPALISDLIEAQAQMVGRYFTLRQLRDDPHLRALLPMFEVENITFAMSSAVIKAEEARNLADLGGLLASYLEDDPSRIFLIEGHSDAKGRAAYNLLLSDRRAESVALALVKYFDIPPENLIVQGYGSSEPLGGAPQEDRRVVVRLISPLLALPQNQPDILPPNQMIERFLDKF